MPLQYEAPCHANLLVSVVPSSFDIMATWVLRVTICVTTCAIYIRFLQSLGQRIHPRDTLVITVIPASYLVVVLIAKCKLHTKCGNRERVVRHSMRTLSAHLSLPSSHIQDHDY